MDVVVSDNLEKLISEVPRLDVSYRLTGQLLPEIILKGRVGVVVMVEFKVVQKAFDPEIGEIFVIFLHYEFVLGYEIM